MTYSTKDIARHCSVTERKVLSWCYLDYARPSIQEANGHGSKRIWSHNDLRMCKLIAGIEPIVRPSFIQSLLKEEV